MSSICVKIYVLIVLQMYASSIPCKYVQHVIDGYDLSLRVLFDFIYVSVSLYRKLGSVCANLNLLPPLDANPMEKEKKFLNRLTVV